MAVLIAAPSSSRAAKIGFIQEPTNGVAMIYLNGDIVPGDEETFHTLALGQKKLILYLNSNGGDVKTALAIGAWISINSYSTAAPVGVCASACGLIWLAGRNKYLSNESHVGFHAAYVMAGATPHESGMWNATIGAYLDSIGVTLPVIQYVTSAPPEQMLWLTKQDAARLGIVTIYPDRTPN